ncbi:hypothetical protein DM01DRAFT_1159600 [Hesseltinella vesiculosa]|uniref:Uncharacterized protein n=1 Tax=Hesseltinella vesiculosa TaxID=101127 RepID=A0A1X2GSE5_9FUNG|nr:hypothetical protein DM01DRAFT_1159600 [Hesseltinella vesiculosa]
MISLLSSDPWHCFFPTTEFLSISRRSNARVNLFCKKVGQPFQAKSLIVSFWEPHWKLPYLACLEHKRVQILFLFFCFLYPCKRTLK